MKKNLQRFGASVLAAAMVAQSVALPAAAETTKIDSSVAQSVAASAASAASAVQSLPKFTSTADLIKQTAQTLAAQGEVHELEQDDAKLEATAQSKAGMSLAALENALADAMYANAAAGKINTEAYGLNKDEMASVMAATIKTYHLSSAVTDLGYETNAAGVVTAVTFTGSSGMTSAMESMTNSDDEVIAQQADSYAQAYVAENSDTFAASAAADGHTYGEPKWYWNDTNPEDGHTHTWKETPDGYWTKTDDGWAYTAVYTCEKDDAYQKVEGTVTKDTTEAKPGAAGKTVYSASVPADKSPVKKEYKEPTTRTDDIAALPCQNHAVPKDADGNFVATFNWEMKKVEGKLDFFSYKVSLTPDQRSRCISYVLQLCKQREKLEFRLISGRIVNDFQYVADPNMFLSGAASYLRLDNNCPVNRIAMVNNSVMEDRLSEYFDQVWNLDDQNVTKERNAIAEHIHHVLQGIHLITRAKSDEMEELQESWMNKI